MYFDEYEAASKFKKMELSERILAMVRASGGRFMKQECTGEALNTDAIWTTVDDTTALRKISHYFRRKRESNGRV